MIVAVTGPDGSGKSTVCEQIKKDLQERWGPQSVAKVSIWDSAAQPGLFSSMEQVVQYLSELEGGTRTLFLYHALSRSMDLAHRKKPKLILVEGYWFKYAATEIAYGVPEDFVLGAAQIFEKPTLTLHLDISPELALKRKEQRVSQYEKGGQSFVEFQRMLAPIWFQIESKFGPWTHLNSSELSSEQLSKAALEEVFRKL
jgi:dTMP kinase